MEFIKYINLKSVLQNRCEFHHLDITKIKQFNSKTLVHITLLKKIILGIYIYIYIFLKYMGGATIKQIYIIIKRLISNIMQLGQNYIL